MVQVFCLQAVIQDGSIGQAIGQPFSMTASICYCYKPMEEKMYEKILQLTLECQLDLA